MGMSGIAKLLLASAKMVSGSDLKETKITEGLKELGARIFIGHRPGNIREADLVVYSSAIGEDNPEIVEAKKLGIPLIRRAEALAELMKDKIVITVSGSHGKTTTTSLVSCLLLEAGLSPTVAIGGILQNINTNAYLGGGSFFVAEADESDGSFLHYRPTYSIITNIDYEHLDYYKEFENEVNTFGKFINNTKKNGCVFACYDDINLRNLLKDYKNKYILFGLEEGADICAKNIGFDGLVSKFDCFYKNKFIDRFHLALGGFHNISNTLSVIALGIELKIEPQFIKKALSSYKGAHRRLEIKLRDRNYTLIDDYAHHPTEIKATLKTVRNLGSNRVIAVFQPHRYTRTKLLLNEFGGSFNLADYIIVTDIYPAGEMPQEGLTSSSIYDKIREHSHNKQIHFLPKEEIVAHILTILKPGDLVITLGAGDIVKTSDELARELKR